ncbi:hypothetical protein [Spiroplasma culicicola]|uniref:Transmembrane protein n=1 Tax=Spiroplasma culicicola AES-1 TaxID=1276246 RepID=W6A722_9MOLU|nr:hypothetical protein [Spiroplasma culicicola]AHI52938.1 hypothetical protein SCULI_v1c05970 [Spiroplasma culicicola AES-1]
MSKKVLNVKQSVFKTLIVSIIFFIFSIICSAIFLVVSDKSWTGITIGIAVLCLVLNLMFIFAIIGGSVFLRVNKKIDHVEKFRARGALDAGLFYFRISSKIDKYIKELENEDKKEEVQED